MQALAETTEPTPGSTMLPASAGGRPLPIDRFLTQLDAWALREYAAATVGKGKTGAEVFEANLRRHAAELAGPNPTPIERTLAETAALCWFRLRWHEVTDLKPGEGRTIPQANLALRRHDAAHRRYLATLRTLATVRKLALPALQINVGTNQVNTLTP